MAERDSRVTVSPDGGVEIGSDLAEIRPHWSGARGVNQLGVPSGFFSRALPVVMSHRFGSMLLVLAALVAPAWLEAGCGASPFSSSSEGSPAEDAGRLVPYQPDAAGSADSTASEQPGAAAVPAAAPAAQGSPLCNASYAGGCYPDLPTTAHACGLEPDGGADGSADEDAAGDTVLACRVQTAADDAGVAPACQAAGAGIDGAWCSQGTSCAAGDECVGGGTCRHYCCAGSSACPLDEFCDVQPTAQAPDTLVPVCMPVEPCILLEDTCPAGQTCGVVRENGETSCVAAGTAQEGTSCEVAHCAAGLVCLGTTGARICYTLCHTVTMAECSNGQTCMTGLPLFPNPAIGWCE